MHNYTVITRKVIIDREHIQRLCFVTNNYMKFYVIVGIPNIAVA